MSLKIMWLGQAGYIFDADGYQIAIDPFCGEAQGGPTRNYPPTIEKGAYHVDAALVSHAHWDHLDPLTIAEYVCAKELIGPASVTAGMEASAYAGKTMTTTLLQGASIERGPFTITEVYADHDGDSCGYVLEYEGKKIFHTGDSVLSTMEMVRHVDRRPDLLLTTINGRGGCMSLPEAAILARLTDAKTVIPMHYDMISNNTEDPELFREPLARIAPQARCVILEKARFYGFEEILG